MKRIHTFELFEQSLLEAKVVVSFAEETALKKALDNVSHISMDWQVKIVPAKKEYEGEETPFAIEVSGRVNDLTDFINIGVDTIGGKAVWTDNKKLEDLIY
jgi:hypothetical protein